METNEHELERCDRAIPSGECRPVGEDPWIRVYSCAFVVSTAVLRFQRLNDSTGYDSTKLKPPPQNQLGDQVVRAVIKPDADSEIDFPLWGEV